MRKLRTSYLSIFFVFALFFGYEAKAQVFENQEPVTEGSENSTPTPKNQNNWFENPRAKAKKEPIKEETKKNPDWATPNKEEKPYIPQAKRPTVDGVKRGYSSMVPIISEKDKGSFDDRLIFVYYTNFNIRTTMSGMLMCDVRFIVLSTLDSRINSLNFRLKWPSMETSLSYEGVTPNTETYYDYTLLGEGCYSMDKIPNIIVNRCRVKGMSSQECANKIKWLRKQ